MIPGLDPDKVARPRGAVDVMIGMNYARLHPIPSDKYDTQFRMVSGHFGVIPVPSHLRVMKSQFGTGLLLDGRHELLDASHVVISDQTHDQARSTVHRVNLVKTKSLTDSFIYIEEDPGGGAAEEPQSQ